MRLAHKLSVAQIVLIGAVLFIHAGIRLRREIRLFEDNMRRDQHETGVALGAAMADMWAATGRERALRLIRDADAAGEVVEISFVPPVAPVPPSNDAAGTGHPLATTTEAAQIVRLDRSGPGPGTLSTYAPVTVGSQIVGGVLISESLADEQRFTRTTVLHMAITTTLLAAGAILISILLGASIIVKPMDALVTQARRVGNGDLEARLHLEHHDEIGELGREMNQMCDRLVEIRAHLAAETSARISALEQLRHADRLATIGTLSSGIAHELGTPLNVVTGRARMIETESADGEFAVTNARIIREQAERMTLIIRQLLDFSRRGGQGKVPADLRPLAEQVLALLGPYAEKRLVKLTLHDDGRAPLLASVDIEQIKQVVTNLVLNGIQATPRGGVLRLRTFRTPVQPPPSYVGDHVDFVCLQVQDEGVGISPEMLPRIFDPFFTTKDVGEGTGLGLSVTYGIVREHGGWIEVESDIGKGSCFKVYLPA
jgi:two-component system, NtrC family, sensor kinase